MRINIPAPALQAPANRKLMHMHVIISNVTVICMLLLLFEFEFNHTVFYAYNTLSSKSDASGIL
jgi:hypothetical protein